MRIKEVRSCLFSRVIALLCMLLLAVQVDMVSAVAANAAVQALATNFTHTAPAYVQPGKRFIISGNISDPSGIKLARCYFRASAESNYVFVTMEAGADNSFKALLPAMSDNAHSLQYLLLAVNNAGQISKTNEFSVDVKMVEGALPKWQKTDSSEPIHVGIEIEPQNGATSQNVTGFSDNITVDVVESSARFLLVSGAAVATGMAASSGSTGVAAGGTAATSGTAAVESSTILGMKSTTFWWVAAGVAAVTVGAIAASSGGGGGGGSKDATIVAHW